MLLRLALPAALALLVAAPSTRPPVRTLAITARDFAYDAPDTVLAGPTAIRVTNAGGELHHAALVRLDAGHTIPELFDAVKANGAFPAWAHEVGGPNTPAPGATATTIVDLKPGSYLLLCVIPSADGTPHVMKGMFRALTVVAASAAGAAPAAETRAAVGDADVTMQLADYGFMMSRPLTAGHHVVRVVNTAAQSHEVLFVRLAPGKTPMDVVDWVEKPNGPPPGEPLGGTVGLASGEWNDVVLDLTPGEYGLLCFLPDAKDGKPHVAHGMMHQFSVR